MVAANTFGRQNVVPLTNKSGGSVAAGDVVIVDSSNNDAFTTTTTGSYTKGIGIAQETIANNATGRVLVGGYAALVNVNASVTRGNFAATHTVAKQATDAGSSRASGTFGIFLTGGTTPDAFIWQPDLGGGSGMTNPMTTAGDIIYSSDGSGTPARLASAGTTNKWLRGANAAAPTWDYPPGYEFDYAQVTSPVSVTATAEASANTLVTGNAVTYDGSTAVIIEFFCDVVDGANTANAFTQTWLYDGSSSIGYLSSVRQPTTAELYVPVLVRRRLTPSAAAHTYSIRATTSTGTASYDAGAGGSGAGAPMYIRITKA